MVVAFVYHNGSASGEDKNAPSRKPRSGKRSGQDVTLRRSQGVFLATST